MYASKNPSTMYRANTYLTKLARIRPELLTSRAFTVTARTMAEGDTGAPPRVGGQGDAFQRREKAAEDFAIREREREKLRALKKQLEEQQAHLKKLSDHIDELSKEQGGELN